MSFTPGKTVAIVNPVAGGGKISSAWAETESALKTLCGAIDVQFTDRPGQAEELARQAVRDHVDEILVVGGDGTISEVVNGMQTAAGADDKDVVLTTIPAGTGGDFRKSISVPDKLDQILDRLRHSEPQRIDIGKICFVDHQGTETTRYFTNIASFGLSGEVDKVVNESRWPKRFGGRFTYAWSTFKAMGKYKPKKIRLRIDDDVDRMITFNTVAVCNGRYFGGGMLVAPKAALSDGLFDIVAIEPQSAISGLRNAPKLYQGRHLDEPNVQSWKGKRIEAIPADETQKALLDVDGEPLGTLPATFEIVAGALLLRQ